MKTKSKNHNYIERACDSQHSQPSLNTDEGNNRTPSLRFTPYAWAKLLFLRDQADAEVGGFGVCSTDDPLLVTDIALVKQQVSCVSVKFDDDSVAEYFDRSVDGGLQPSQFARIWIHTHPGDSPRPSGTDKECFARVFGDSDWAVMFILAQGGRTFGRLRFNAGPGGETELDVAVDYRPAFPASDAEAWAKEYAANVTATKPLRRKASDDLRDLSFDDDWLEDFEDMELEEQQAVFDEFEDPAAWWEEAEVWDAA